MKQIEVLETMKKRKQKGFLKDVAFEQPGYIMRLEDAPINRCQRIKLLYTYDVSSNANSSGFSY